MPSRWSIWTSESGSARSPPRRRRPTSVAHRRRTEGIPGPLGNTVGLVLGAGIAAAAGARGAPAHAEIPLTETLELGGHIEIAYERLQNFDLDRAEGDNLDLIPTEVELNLLFDPNGYLDAYLQLLFLRQFSLGERGDDRVENTSLLVEEAYVRLEEPDAGVALQLGRQSFEDARKWLYDADLDGARGMYERPRLALEISASREALIQQDLLNQTEKETINNYVAYGAYALDEDVTVGAYGIVIDHRDGPRDRPIFLGLQSFGTLGDRLTYWLDAALVRGREDDRDLRGYGFDVLGTYRFDAPFSPYAILGYAFGSGDGDPDDDRDGAFRQTGLQSNETEVGGLTELRYYGEAFDPELSNMSIFTAGIGARPLAGVSADLVYHYYLQNQASDQLRDAAIDAEPSGLSRRLGSEIDLVVGLEELENVRIRGFLGYFMPGRAFADARDNALLVRLEARFEF